MAWIESHQSLLTHRKTLRAAALLRIDRHKLIGHLHALWWWGLDNATNNGHLGSVLDEEIAEAAGWPVRRAEQFVSVLVEAGFLDRDGVKLGLHDWWEYAGKLNAKRAKDRARKAEVAGNSAGIPVEVAGKSQAPNQPTNQPNQPLPNGSNQPAPVLALLATLYQENFGTINSSADASLRDWAERIPEGDVGTATVKFAFAEATANGVLTWAYVQGVLKRLEAEGWPCDDAEPEPVDRTAELNAEVEQLLEFRKGATA